MHPRLLFQYVSPVIFSFEIQNRDLISQVFHCVPLHLFIKLPPLSFFLDNAFLLVLCPRLVIFILNSNKVQPHASDVVLKANYVSLFQKMMKEVGPKTKNWSGAHKQTTVQNFGENVIRYLFGDFPPEISV